MSNAAEPFQPEDVFDSRDVIERLAFLQGSADDPETEMSEEELTEFTALRALAEEGKDYADWQYGETFIEDAYFETYARELADDLGLAPTGDQWPGSYIDWEAAADALRVDYTPIEFQGRTWWARA